MSARTGSEELRREAPEDGLDAARPPEERGKRRFFLNIHSVLVLGLALALCVLVCVCIHLTRKLDKGRGRLLDMTQQVYQSKASMGQMQDDIRGLWGQQLEDAMKETLLHQRLRFWEEHCVIVTRAGEKYHTFACSSLRENTEFQMLNVEAAVTRGYAPCSRCHPPEVEIAGENDVYTTYTAD